MHVQVRHQIQKYQFGLKTEGGGLGAVEIPRWGPGAMTLVGVRGQDPRNWMFFTKLFVLPPKLLWNTNLDISLFPRMTPTAPQLTELHLLTEKSDVSQVWVNSCTHNLLTQQWVNLKVLDEECKQTKGQGRLWPGAPRPLPASCCPGPYDGCLVRWSGCVLPEGHRTGTTGVLLLICWKTVQQAYYCWLAEKTVQLAYTVDLLKNSATGILLLTCWKRVQQYCCWLAEKEYSRHTVADLLKKSTTCILLLTCWKRV